MCDAVTGQRCWSAPQLTAVTDWVVAPTIRNGIRTLPDCAKTSTIATGSGTSVTHILLAISADMLSGPMLQGRDGVGAAPCCGTGVVFKRDVLVSIGGQAYGSITEVSP